MFHTSSPTNNNGIAFTLTSQQNDIYIACMQMLTHILGLTEISHFNLQLFFFNILPPKQILYVVLVNLSTYEPIQILTKYLTFYDFLRKTFTKHILTPHLGFYFLLGLRA